VKNQNNTGNNKDKHDLLNSTCLLYLPAFYDWEYTDSVSLASVVAYQTGNPSCMGSVVHQTLHKFERNNHAHTNIVYATIHLYYVATPTRQAVTMTPNLRTNTININAHTHTHTCTHSPFNSHFPGNPG